MKVWKITIKKSEEPTFVLVLCGRETEISNQGSSETAGIIWKKSVFSLNASNYKNTCAEHCMYNNMVKKCEILK